MFHHFNGEIFAFKIIQTRKPLSISIHVHPFPSISIYLTIHVHFYFLQPHPTSQVRFPTHNPMAFFLSSLHQIPPRRPRDPNSQSASDRPSRQSMALCYPPAKKSWANSWICGFEVMDFHGEVLSCGTFA